MQPAVIYAQKMTAPFSCLTSTRHRYAN